jgi:RimJ/RimL family protein N-acetyltransferase
MIPLYNDPHFTFCFADDRIIPRIHLEGIEAGRRVSVFKIDPTTGERLGLLANATVGEGGWVDLDPPIIVRAGDAFVAVTTDESIRLRPVQPGDLPRMYDLQLDSESNRMAVTIPRTREAFDSHWAKALDDPRNIVRVILFGEEFVGTISCFPMDGQDHVEYWIDRAYWGMGIASHALHLLLREVTKRPLVAAAATSNGASLRVLQKCGFVVERVSLSPTSDRFLECEEAILVLR